MIHRLLRGKFDSRTETIWLTVYADLMTNMLLVFLALYGLTIMGDDALARAVQSMKISDMYSSKDSELSFEDLAPVLRQELRYEANVKVFEGIGSVRIEFGEQSLFESGKADPKSASDESLKKIAEFLREMPNTVIVEGHTDSIPLQRGSQFRDNEALSLARAMSIVNILIKNGVLQDQLAAAAYGAYRPRASNDTALGRKINRRVEIALFKDFPYERRNK